MWLACSSARNYYKYSTPNQRTSAREIFQRSTTNQQAYEMHDLPFTMLMLGTLARCSGCIILCKVTSGRENIVHIMWRPVRWSSEEELCVPRVQKIIFTSTRVYKHDSGDLFGEEQLLAELAAPLRDQVLLRACLCTRLCVCIRTCAWLILLHLRQHKQIQTRP